MKMKTQSKILVVDDDAASRLSTIRLLHGLADFVEAESSKEAMAFLREGSIGLILLDYWMPDVVDTDLLSTIKSEFPKIPLLVLTACSDATIAVACLKARAEDYVVKDRAEDCLRDRVSVLLASSNNNSELISDPTGTFFIPNHPLYQNAYRLALAAASKSLNVLITGPTGSGKDVLAQVIHQRYFSDSPLVVLNCGAIVESLAESELFGCEAHAFTGAVETVGKLELADGGVLFLDELSSMPEAVQVKFLRALETGEFYRVGGTKIRRSRFVLIAACNADLNVLMNESAFRSDLFYRVRDIHVKLPSLSEVPEVVESFISFFEETYNRDYGEAVQLSLLERQRIGMACDGNVRSLKKEVRNCIALRDLYYASSAQEGRDLTFKDRIELFEKQTILQGLKQCGFNISKTADLLNIKRSTLSEKMKRYQLINE